MMQKIRDIFLHFYHFFFYFCLSLHLLCIGRAKSGHDFEILWKSFVPLPIKLLKVYLPTPFCKFFSQKWNIPSLIASFRRHLDGTSAEKIIFSTNHTWELEECQMIFFKIKKEAPTFIVSAYHMSLLILKNSCGKSTGVLVIFFIPFSSFLRLTIRWLLLLKRLA